MIAQKRVSMTDKKRSARVCWVVESRGGCRLDRPVPLLDLCERPLFRWSLLAAAEVGSHGLTAVVPRDVLSVCGAGVFPAGLSPVASAEDPFFAAAMSSVGSEKGEAVVVVMSSACPLLTPGDFCAPVARIASGTGYIRVGRPSSPVAAVFSGDAFADFRLFCEARGAGDGDALSEWAGQTRFGGPDVGPPDSPCHQRVTDCVGLAEAEKEIRRRIRLAWLEAGVTMIDPDRVLIGPDVALGSGVVLYPDVVLAGDTTIGDRCVILPGSFLENASLAEGVRVEYSVIRNSKVGARTSVGPFAHIREGAVVGAENRVGNFVEIKKSTTGAGTKASHLSYLGDASIGRHVNIGAGTITCNYDGRKKHQTVVGDNAFIGSDSILVAPVHVGENAYTAAGSTITEDVPEDSLGIGRARQRNVLGWGKRERATDGGARQ